MISLIDILKRILKEDIESEKGISQGNHSEEFIKYIDKQIKSYHTNNNVIRKIEDGNFDAVEINFDNLTIQISSNKYPTVHDADFVPPKGKNGKALIKINKANIKTKPKLEVEYDESSLKHELKHYFDSLDNSPEFKKNVEKQLKINTSNGSVTNHDEYWNNPNEVNAYFFEHFMPDILKFLKKEKEIPSSLEEFKKDVFKNSGSNSFFKKLNDTNKQKIDKRLEIYYTDILTNPNFKIEDKNNHIDNSRLEKSTYGFIKKLKDKLGLF